MIVKKLIYLFGLFGFLLLSQGNASSLKDEKSEKTFKQKPTPEETRHSYIPDPMKFDYLDNNRGVAVFKRKENSTFFERFNRFFLPKSLPQKIPGK